MDNIGMFLKHTVEQFGPQPALLYRPKATTETWTYAELWEKTSRVARWLQDQGVEKGDRVIIWAPNSPMWVATYFAALRTGVILVPLDVRSSDDFVKRIVGQTDPKLALLSPTTRKDWQSTTPACTLEELEALLPEAEPGDVSVSPDDLAVLMFTSGTTGDPKGVILTHYNILSNVDAADKYVPPTPHFRTVSILPLSHMFEQTVGLLMSLKRGASIYYLSNMQPSAIFGALNEHGATTLLLVPQALQLFMSTIEREVAKQGKVKQVERLMQIARFLPMGIRRRFFRPLHHRLGGMLEFLVSGGAPIDPALVRKWELMGIPIIQGYGATEASPIISASQMHDRNPQTVGKPVPGMEVKIAADGEILLKGPNITQGYWRNPQATEAAFEDGWYKTGDLGYVDEKGRLYLHGRKKDMIALPNGQKVYPQDVEQVLLGLAGVLDAVVIGLPSSQGQHEQQVYAVLLPRPGETIEPDLVIREANTRLAPHQRIKDATIWPEADFPRTHTLKVKKHEVLKAVQEMQAQKDKTRVSAGAR